MEKAVSAADANRNFSQLLRGVRRGLSYVVTSHGHAVARISAVEAPEPSAARAREVLLKRLEQQPAKKVGRWTRDELYED
jgi:prevent-host-death family protein